MPTSPRSIRKTNLTRAVVTTENGDYEILDLPRGSYRLTATHPGFKTFIADRVVLESSQVRRIDVALELGAATAEVTVHADAAVIATESGKIQETFEKQRFEELPLIGDGRTPRRRAGVAALDPEPPAASTAFRWRASL